jgi:hypothetical protein
MNKQKKKDVQCILTSLYYLSGEATRRNLPEVSTLLVTAINGVAAWIDDGKNNSSGTGGSASLIDDSLYHAMNFLHNLAKLSKGRSTDFKKVLESITMQFHEQYQIVLKADPDERATISNNSKARNPRQVRH